MWGIVGRPSIYTPELADFICKEISLGKSILQLCREYKDNEEFPHVDTVRHWLRTKPDFSAKYYEAKEYQGDSKFDKIDDVIQDMRAGVVDAQMAKVEMDALKWQAARLRPRIYGDKQIVESKNENINVNTKLPISQADRDILKDLGWSE